MKVLQTPSPTLYSQATAPSRPQQATRGVFSEVVKTEQKQGYHTKSGGLRKSLYAESREPAAFLPLLAPRILATRPSPNRQEMGKLFSGESGHPKGKCPKMPT